jgi:methionyl-tRNA formyltransferase
LPEYRGAAPIQRSLMDGKEYLGLSSFYLNDKIDGGNIIYNKKILINNKITYGEAYELLSKKSAPFTIETINKIIKGYTGIKQQINKTTYAKKINKNDYLINLDNDSKIVHDKIRALTPPGCFIYFNKRKVKLLNTFFVSKSLPVGTFTFENKKLIVGCKKGSLEVSNIQFEGKKVIDSKDFSNMNVNKNLIFTSLL